MNHEHSHFEPLIQGLLENQLGVMEGFFPIKLTNELRAIIKEKLVDQEMHPAGVGQHFTYRRNTAIRGDLIHWINNDSKHPAEQAFLSIIQSFIQYLNQTCYTNINDYEFHYAYYDVGSFYKRHLDQFHQDSGRKFSFVTYLNEDWTIVDGGELIAYTDNHEQRVLPTNGTVVFFKANEVEHEVKPAHRPRMSIAGWLKRSEK